MLTDLAVLSKIFLFEPHFSLQPAPIDFLSGQKKNTALFSVLRLYSTNVAIYDGCCKLHLIA